MINFWINEWINASIGKGWGNVLIIIDKLVDVTTSLEFGNEVETIGKFNQATDQRGPLLKSH